MHQVRQATSSRHTTVRTSGHTTGRLQRLLTPALVLVAAAALLGCENMSARERGGAQGAGVGAVAGAVLGSATGGSAGQGAVIGGVLGAVAGNLWSKRMEDKRKDLEAATAGTGIEVARTNDDQLRVNVPADLSFAINSAALQPAARPFLDRFAQGLDGNLQVRIVGHTDSTGGDSLNEALSLERARSVRDHLLARGVPASHMDVVGRGAREPISSNSSDAGRANNRRVEIFLREPRA